MDGADTAIAFLGVAAGIIIGFFIWSYVVTMLPGATTA